MPAATFIRRIPHANRLYGIESNGGEGSQTVLPSVMNEYGRSVQATRLGCCLSASLKAS